VERLRAPRCARDSSAFDAIVALVERLERTASADEAAYIALQTRIAALYDLDEAEWRHIVSTFPLIDKRVRHACVETFRT
jgi:hypothetical protein